MEVTSSNGLDNAFILNMSVRNSLNTSSLSLSDQKQKVWHLLE